MNNSFDRYLSHNRRISLLWNAVSILNLDSRLHLPEEWSKLRSEQVWILSEIIHKLITDKRFEKLCHTLSKEEQDEFRRRNVEITVKDIIDSKKIPAKFVKEYSEFESLCEDEYYRASEESDFVRFVPFLEKMVAMQRKRAEYLGIKWTHYNTLLNEYDEWLTEEMLTPVFERVKNELLPIVRKIYAQENKIRKINIEFKDQSRAMDMYKEILEEIWYDMKRGTIIDCPSSYMIAWNPQDTRMMIRNSWKVQDMIGSVIHEWWHWIYEQWFKEEFLWLPVSSSTSYTIHESQSRFYELFIWNSRPYINRILKKLKKSFPKETWDLTFYELYEVVNQVAPIARRVEADELSYHIHIMIRFEIEKDLINGKIQAKDVKDIWDAKYKEYLWIEFENDWEWVLQDIHWAWWNFWYFPTYSLGTFYAAQFFDKLKEVFPDIEEKMANWDLLDIKKWLNENVHQFWRLRKSEELLKSSTWKGLDIWIFIKYAKEKYSKLYWIEL